MVKLGDRVRISRRAIDKAIQPRLGRVSERSGFWTIRYRPAYGAVLWALAYRDRPHEQPLDS